MASSSSAGCVCQHDKTEKLRHPLLSLSSPVLHCSLVGKTELANRTLVAPLQFAMLKPEKKHEYFVTPPATPSSYLSNVMRTAPTGVQRFKRSSILLSSIITYACMLPRQIHGPWVPSEDLDLRRAPDRARGCGPPRQAATRR